MNLTWTSDLTRIDWHALSDLYLAAPLGAQRKPADKLHTCFTHSLVRWFVFDAERLVGAGRALCDGAEVAYLADIAFLPAYQGQGLGAEMMRRLLEPLAGYGKVILYSVPGKEPFYRRFGFDRMTTAMARFSNQAAAFERGYLRED